MLGTLPWHFIKKVTDPGCTNRKVRPPASCPGPQGAGDIYKSVDKPEDLHLT
jgi:hypothetical protein